MLPIQEPFFHHGDLLHDFSVRQNLDLLFRSREVAGNVHLTTILRHGLGLEKLELSGRKVQRMKKGC